MLQSIYLVTVQIMPKSNDKLDLDDDKDAIDSYFECITACSLNAEGVECITECVSTHLKEDYEE